MLINCTECGKEISDHAAACPNCGCPVNPPEPQPARPHEDDYRYVPPVDYDDVDELEDVWKIIVWGSILLPFGATIIVILTSVQYYRWRDRWPEKVSAINLHG